MLEVLVLVLLIGMVKFFAPKVKEKLEVNRDLRDAVIKGAKNVDYKESTLRHIKRSDKKLKAEFRVLTHQISMLGEFWSAPVLDGYGINLECIPEFEMFLESFKEVLNSSCPYEECSEAMRFIRAFEDNFFNALLIQMAEEEKRKSYEPYSWLGDFLPEVAMTEE